MVELTCSNCGNRINTAEESAGPTPCPQCGHQVPVAPPAGFPGTVAPESGPLVMSAMAVTALVLSLIGCIFPLGIVALVLGLVALSRISKPETACMARASLWPGRSSAASARF